MLPIEGEALVVTWGLEQTRYFTQGCDNLLVVTDHKPLVKIFSDRTLDEITNTRLLFRLKQRTLPWRFRIVHLPGKTNHATDATSRHPAPSGEMNCMTIEDQVEMILIAAIRGQAEEVTAISWSRLAQETHRDATMHTLLTAV